MSQIPNRYNPNSFTPYQADAPQPLGYAADQATASAVNTFFNAVFAWMFAGLSVTAGVAWYCAAHTEILRSMGGAGMIILIVAQLALVWAISGSIQRISAPAATGLFLLYAALNGIMLSVIFMIYTHAVLGAAFAVTAGMFGAMSLYGFFTKKDLTSLGSMFFMALIGLILASAVSLFWHSTMLVTLINYGTVLVFVGLTAYDTQRLKIWALQTSGNSALAARLAVSGALSLYLDFLNLFLAIVRILGNSRSND